VSLARSRHNDGRRLLKKQRQLASQSCVLKDGAGPPRRLAGPHLAVADVVPLIPPTASRAVAVQDKTSWTWTLGVRMPGLGTVRLVVRCANAELTGTSAVWVTKRVEGSAQRSIPLSGQRWPRDTLSQDGKTPLGLDEYRMRNAAASGTPWGLVFVAYALVPRDCLAPSPTTGRAPRNTLGEACRQQAQALIPALILSAHDRLQRGQRAEDLFAHWFAKQQTVMARCECTWYSPKYNSRGTKQSLSSLKTLYNFFPIRVIERNHSLRSGKMPFSPTIPSIVAPI
jgi:hypothetical protein